MDIRNKRIFLVEEDIPLSRIARFFKPQDAVAKDFLSKRYMLYYEGASKKEERVPSPGKEDIAICLAPKGETLRSVLLAISGEGWSYGTLGDWHRYHARFPFPEGEIISTPGTTYFDENFSEWVPFVSPWSNSFFQKIIKRDKGVVANIFMKSLGSLVGFQTDRKILISRIIE